MPHLNDMVSEVADLVNDNEPGCEHVRWSAATIRHWLLEGYALATTVATHKNSVVVDVPLNEGSIQELPEGYEMFVRLLSNPGKLEKIVDAAEKTAKDRFVGIYDDVEPDCTTSANGSTVGVKQTSDDEYSVDNWQSEPMSATTFYVDPPVPAGYTGSVRVLAVKEIDLTSDDVDIPMWAHALAIDWAVHRVYTTEAESQYAIEKAAAYRRHFYEILALFKPPETQRSSSSISGISQGGAV